LTFRFYPIDYRVDAGQTRTGPGPDPDGTPGNGEERAERPGKEAR